MKINLVNIISDRKFESWVSFQLIYEWEDRLSKELNIPIVDNPDRVETSLVNSIKYHLSERVMYPLTKAFRAIKKLVRKDEKNGVSNILWKTKETDKTWTYIPNQKYLFHRYIHIGSFMTPAQNYSISEVIGEHSLEEMTLAGKEDNFLMEPAAHSISDYAYVVFDKNYDTSTQALKNYLQEVGLYTLGRFGEWQYYNMDVCIKKAIDLSKVITDKLS